MAKISTLVSDFATMPAFLNDNYGSPTVSGGTLHITTTSNEYNASTGATYDATNSYSLIQMPYSAGILASCATYMMWVAGSSGLSFYQADGGDMGARITTSGTDVDHFLGNSQVTGLWWRIREASGTAYWDTSTDGVTWTNHYSATHGLTLTAVVLRFESTSWSGTTQPDSQFDNLNNPPAVTTFNPALFMPFF